MKKTLTERDICTQYITPAIVLAGWDLHKQVREEVTFTAGKIIVRGKLHTSGKSKRADYILYHKPNLPIAVIEAKDKNRSISDGMQQALGYTALWERKRLDLTVEALILNPQWHDLFSDADRDVAQKRLQEYGYYK